MEKGVKQIAMNLSGGGVSDTHVGNPSFKCPQYATLGETSSIISSISCDMPKQIAINLYNGVCGTIHAIGGTHCPSNILPPPQPHKVRSNSIYKCLTGHYHKISSRNIFRGFQEQAFIVIQHDTKI